MYLPTLFDVVRHQKSLRVSDMQTASSTLVTLCHTPHPVDEEATQYLEFSIEASRRAGRSGTDTILSSGWSFP